MQAACHSTSWRTRKPRRSQRRDRPPRARFPVTEGARIRRTLPPVLALWGRMIDWPGFWGLVQRELRQAGFQPSTLVVYRQVLRSLRHHLELQYGEASARSQPGALTAAAAHDYLSAMNDRHASWSWVSVNISVLRTAFDKLGGLQTTARLRTPKRPQHLGEVVSGPDVARMLAVSPTARDRLLIGLLYGCGLKVSEACRLRWADVDVANQCLAVHYAGGTRQRKVELPEALLPVLEAGRARCEPDTYVFAGDRGPHVPLSARMAQRVIRRAAREAGLEKPVCCMTMRHGYAVSLLREGADVRTLQERLGHQRVQTTMRYERYSPPAGAVSPLDRPRFAPAGTMAPPEPNSAFAGAPRATPDSIACVPEASDLLASPPSLLALPFSELANGVREYHAQMKSRISDRFLALRAPALKSG
ncbi:MAG: tyrosine-type recombinase/integrase [Lentisphaerae bacterium]|nr:tyrosine-type recombinase/integrase [Lentisphaerota bacterium]